MEEPAEATPQLDGEEEKANSADIIVLDQDNEDDVPGDFFDDFLNEDFMAALDILDDDQWESQKHKVVTSDKNEVKPKKSKDKIAEKLPNKVAEKPQGKVAVKPQGKVSVKPQGKVAKKPQAKNAEKPPPAEEKTVALKKTKSKSSNSIQMSSKSRISGDSNKAAPKGEAPRMSTGKPLDRRDPQKTRKAIELDKSKCERDKENKIISEKLQLVETGLVPPGMEMEMDLEKIKQQKEFQKSRSTQDDDYDDTAVTSRSRASMKSIPTSSRPPPKIPKSMYVRRPTSRGRLSRSPYRNYSPRRSPRISRSPRRSKERISRRSRSQSPRRRPRYSPGYRRDYRSRSRRDRSESPESRRRRVEKKSFLQEIVEKLREPSRVLPPVQMPMMNQPYMETPSQLMPMPVPVPPPMLPVPNMPIPQPGFSVNPGLAPYDPFDQSYFIGNNPPMPMPQNMSYEMAPDVGHPMNNMNECIVLPLQSQPPQPEPLQQPPAGGPEPIVSPQDSDDQEQINQLFHDKTISLSEFLTITAKPDASTSSSAELKEKIQIIRRCQEGISILSSSEKPPFTGVLYLKRKTDVPPPTGVSPFFQQCTVKIPFCDPTGKTKSLDKFIDFVDQSVKSVKTEEPEESADPADSKFGALVPPPPPQISTTCSLSTTTQGVQTEASVCLNCEQRKNIATRTISTQCFYDKLTFSVSTQVSQNDLEPKSESLASLTPAQLLSKSYNKPAPKKFDEFEQYKNARSATNVRSMDYQPPFERGPEKPYHPWLRDEPKFNNYPPRDGEFNRGRPQTGQPGPKNRFKFF